MLSIKLDDFGSFKLMTPGLAEITDTISLPLLTNNYIYSYSNILPRSSGIFTLGDSAHLWDKIYCKESMNTTVSDEREKTALIAIDKTK